jgi:hypothetical protein
MSVHDLLVDLAGSHIKSYRGDLLVHDKTEIERNPGIPFLHWTRESGTHLAMLRPSHKLPAAGEIVPILFGKGDREVIVENVVGMAEYHNSGKSEPVQLALYCDGEKFFVTNTATALLVAIAYQRFLQVEWAVETEPTLA